MLSDASHKSDFFLYASVTICINFTIEAIFFNFDKEVGSWIYHFQKYNYFSNGR